MCHCGSAPDMDYNLDCPAWGNLSWPKVGEFNVANGGRNMHRSAKTPQYAISKSTYLNAIELHHNDSEWGYTLTRSCRRHYSPVTPPGASGGVNHRRTAPSPGVHISEALPNKHRYHVAIFQGFGERKPGGGYWRIWVLDQWRGKPLARRYKRAWTPEEFKIRNPAPADDADQFYVVMVP